MRMHVLRARADVVATKLGIIGVNEVRAHVRLRARADIVATKLGIIFLSFSSFLPHTFLPEGVFPGS